MDRVDLAKVIYPFLVSDPADGYHDRWPRPKRPAEFWDALQIADAVMTAQSVPAEPPH